MVRRFLYLRLLRWILLVGAFFDFAVSLVLVWRPELLARLLGSAPPRDEIWLQITAVFVLMLGALYFAAAREPRRYSAIIVVAVLGHLLGALVFGVAAGSRPGSPGLWMAAILDFSFAAAVGWFWRAWRR